MTLPIRDGLADDARRLVDQMRSRGFKVADPVDLRTTRSDREAFVPLPEGYSRELIRCFPQRRPDLLNFTDAELLAEIERRRVPRENRDGDDFRSFSVP